MKYEMRYVDELWSLNYVVYRDFLFNGSTETVSEMIRKHCIATFVYEDDAKKYCDYMNTGVYL